jgi:WD40 repeat protein
LRLSEVTLAKVFISYATSDRPIAEEVMRWLRAAGHQPFLDHDIKDGISVGEVWKQRLYRQLRDVDAVIGVVTWASVASTWCSAELGIADALGCRIMPLRAEARVEHPLMENLQYADYHTNRRDARDRVLHTLRLLDGGGRTWKEGNNPFPGLEPFTAGLSRVFFGRATEVREVGNLLRGTSDTGGLLVIVGPSGCGKSSLLNAAVVPMLDNDPAWLTVPKLVPGTDPLSELTRALAVRANGLGLGWSAGDVRVRLKADTDGLRRVTDDLLAASAAAHGQLVVPIDQAEELFTRAPSAALHEFVRALRDGTVGRVKVVAAMRSEFLDDIREIPELAGVPIQAYVLAPLDREMLRDVIEQPAKVARLQLEEGLAATLVAATGSGEALPLLAFVLHQLASGLPAGGTLTLLRYHDLGGVGGALTRHADAALTDAVQASGLAERDVLSGLTRLVAVDASGRYSRRRVSLTGLPDQLRAALQVFVDRRLLLSNTDGDGHVWLTVVHEALFTGWKPLHTAITDITVALHMARTVEQAAAEWDRAGRAEHYLWEQERLAATITTLELAGDGGRPGVAVPSRLQLDDAALEFLDETEQHVRNIEARERRRRNRTMTVLSVLLLAALIAAGLAFWQQRVARDAQYIAIARGMAAQAERIRDRDPRGALQLGVAAVSLDGSPPIRTNLLQTLTSASRFRTLRGHSGAVIALAYSPDGRSLATGSDDGTAIVWDLGDLASPRQVGRPLIGTGPVVSAAFASDGSTLATAAQDGSVVLWDLRDRDQLRQQSPPLTGHTDAVIGIAFAPDGRTLATASADHSLRLWDVAERDRPRELGRPMTTHSAAVYGVAFTPDGNTLASAGGDGEVVLWDLTNRGQPRELGPPLISQSRVPVAAVAFAPDGRTLAGASANGTVALWDLGDRDRPRQLGEPLIGHTDAVYGVAFSPDGRTLATAGADQSVKLWDLGDPDQPRQLGQPLTGHTGVAWGVAFAPDGRTLASASADSTIVLWDLRDQGRSHQVGQPLTGHVGVVDGVAFAPDGRTLASAGQGDRRVILWDLTDRDRPRQLGQPLTGHTSSVLVVAFARDGRTLASASADGDVILWDLTDRDRPRRLSQPLTGHTGAVNGVAFSPDGRVIATAGADQSARLWDVTDRERPRPLGEPLKGHKDAVFGVAFAPDGRTLATAGAEGALILWDLTERNLSRQLGRPLAGHSNVVYGVAFAPDGRTLASAGGDEIVVLWDVTDRLEPRQLGQPLIGHTDAVYGVTFSPDGRTLASASADRSVRLWNVAERDRPLQLGQPLAGHTDAVRGVATGPDGHVLATASADQSVQLWSLPDVEDFAGGEVGEACARAGGPLDRATWDRYAPSLGYQDTCAGH